MKYRIRLRKWLTVTFVCVGCTSGLQASRTPAAASAQNVACSESWMSNGSMMYLTGCPVGNVGIGTTNPAGILDVEGGTVHAIPSNINIIAQSSSLSTPGGSVTINPGSGTAYGNILLATPGGNVGIGTTTPTQALEVNGSVQIDNGQDLIWGNWSMGVGAGNGTTALQVYNSSSGAVAMAVSDSGNVTAANFTMTSDQRFKKDVKPLTGQLDKIVAMNPVSFTWNSLAQAHGIVEKDRQIGFIAQDVEKLFPEAVRTAEDGYKSVNYSALASPIVESVKELDAKLKEKDAQIEKLEKRIEKLESQLAKQYQAEK